MMELSHHFPNISEVDVGELHISVNLQPVDLSEVTHAVTVVAQVLPVDKHLELLAPATDRHLTNKR